MTIAVDLGRKATKQTNKQLYIWLCFAGTDIRYQAGLGEEVTWANWIASLIVKLSRALYIYLLLHQLYIRLCFAGTDIRYQAGLGEEDTWAEIKLLHYESSFWELTVSSYSCTSYVSDFVL